MKKNGVSGVLGNIEEARRLSRDNDSVRIVAVVSGSETDKDTWQVRFDEVGPYIFNNNGSTLVLSLQEKTGDKTREGNFLGTLLAYRYIKEAASKAGVPYREFATLVGMLFGRGERMSPVTQSKGCRKPAAKVTPSNVEIGSGKTAFTAIEEALLYFTPVVRYFEKRGFRGILNKWGDETEIASIDLAEEPCGSDSLAEYDVIKIISVLEITGELARQKEWVVFDEDKNMLAQLSRNKKEVLIGQLKGLGIRPREDGKYYAGISLGPVAISYDVLDIAAEIFADEIEDEKVYFDFDPYFFMALAMEDDPGPWKAAIEADEGLRELTGMVPDLFEKVQRIKKVFHNRHGRALNLKTFDLGSSVYWADIGQHRAMREKYLSLNDKGAAGVIARKIANIPDARDENGNIIVDSKINPDVIVKDSVIVNSILTGSGKIERSVIIDSELGDVGITGAFVVRSVRTGRTVLAERSGIYNSLGADELVLEKGMRHVSVLTSKRKVDMKCAEETDLRDKENTYNVPISGNDISFSDAYNEMLGVSMEELEKRRAEEIGRLKRKKDKG